MALSFKKGEAVKQIVPAPFTGAITTIKVDADSGEVVFLVTDAEGTSRWFTETELEAVIIPDAEPAV
jgi:hypothetical protein